MKIGHREGWVAAFAVCAFLMALPPTARAQEPTGSGTEAGRATLEVSPLSARIGDPLAAKLVVELPAGSRIDPPALESSFGPFAVLSGSWSGPDSQAGVSRWTWNGALAAYETGPLTIPAVSLSVVGPSGTNSMKSDPVVVTIESILPSETGAGAGSDTASAEIADLKPPASVAPNYGPLRVALAIVAGLLAAAVLAWWLNRRYAGRLAAVPAPEDPFRRVPPHQWAYEELQRLLERRLPESGDAEQFFAELSWILKRYLSGRFRVDLMEHTTEEVIPLLRQAGAPAAPLDEVRPLLVRCDLVKFAKQRADTETCRTAMEEAYRIVDRTKPAEVSVALPAVGAA